MKYLLIVVALLVTTKAESTMEPQNVPPPLAEEKAQFHFADALELLKDLEGFEPVAKWDVNRYRFGYGTEAETPSSVISESEAADRAKHILLKCATEITTKYPHLTYRQRLALAVMKYNVGSFGPVLHNACRTGMPKDIRRAMQAYVYSDSHLVHGLADRRKREADFGGF